MVPLQIILPLIITRYTTGPQPMNVFLKAMPYRYVIHVYLLNVPWSFILYGTIWLRLLMGLEFAVIVWWAPSTRTETGQYPVYFYVVVLLSYALHQVSMDTYGILIDYPSLDG